MFDEPAAEHRTDSGRDRGEARPRADRFTAFLFIEGRADQRQAAGHKQRASDSLKRACGDQLFDIRRQATRCGSNGEDDDTDIENLSATVSITERATYQQQRGKKKRVGLDDPLNTDRRGVQIGLQKRQRDVDDGTVDKRHAGGKNCGSENPTPVHFEARQEGSPEGAAIR